MVLAQPEKSKHSTSMALSRLIFSSSLFQTKPPVIYIVCRQRTVQALVATMDGMHRHHDAFLQCWILSIAQTHSKAKFGSSKAHDINPLG